MGLVFVAGMIAGALIGIVVVVAGIMYLLKPKPWF
jgi:hypothetical protein